MRKLIFAAFLLLHGTLGIASPTNEPGDLCIQKNHVTISAGYGAPSILRAFLKYNNTRSEYTVKGWGPYMFKIDWMFHRRWSIGINGSYSFSRLSWMDDGWDTVIHAKRLYEYGIEAEELAATLRVNYHFLIRKKIDLYAGLGAGYGKFALGTYTEAPVNQFSVAYEFPKPLSLEATLGGRYYITKWLGLYAELGLGKSWILFRKKFLPESLIQAGINIKMPTSRKKGH